jgi:curved DNA-binding protein CbpA
MGERSHYDVLGVALLATSDEVRAAYRRAARDHHPDTGGTAHRMSEINAAWYVLGDPARRAAYDRELAGGPPSGAAASSAGGPAGTSWSVDADAYRSEEDWADLADATPVREARSLEGWEAIVPPATLLAAVAVLMGAFVFSAPGLLAVAGGLFVLAFGFFAIAPLRAMSRKPR